MNMNPETARYMTVRQVAEFLQLNEKKVYALAAEGEIPCTKITGKWMFPRELIDRWMLESAHGGVLTDRLVVAGSEDPLLYRALLRMSHNMQTHALISYTGTGTRLGLGLMAAHRADVCCMHWGPAEESQMRHPALLSHYTQHRNWTLVRACKREQGIMLHPGLFESETDAEKVLKSGIRWVMRQDGSGSQRFLHETLTQRQMTLDDLRIEDTAFSNREAACMINHGHADAAPGVRGVANEFGLGFVGIGWENLDFAVSREVYFRTLFQTLLECLKSPEIGKMAVELGGYEMEDTGDLVWGGQS